MRTLFILIILVAAGVLWIRHLERTRPQDLPWTPLDLRAPIGRATGMKLRQLAADPTACHAALDRAGIGYAAIPDSRRDGQACGFRNAVVLTRSTMSYRPTPVRLSCPMAAALVVWEREVVRPEARRRLAGEVATILNFGSYSCRRLYGQTTGRWSQHATANAFDIAGFRLADGRQVSVLRDWKRTSANAAFLREVRDGACRLFGTTLSPDYNAAHRDHLHVDMGGWGTCR